MNGGCASPLMKSTTRLVATQETSVLRDHAWYAGESRTDRPKRTRVLQLDQPRQLLLKCLHGPAAEPKPLHLR